MRKISAILLCLSIVAVAGTAVADDSRTEAADRFDHGLRLFNEGDNLGALLEFKRAYELSGERSILVNVGLVYAEMGRPVEAVEALDKALAQPAGIPEAQVERGRRVREEQNTRIGRLLVTTSLPAQIEIDNLVVGRTPLAAPISVASGLRLLAVVAPGQVPVHQEVAISGGQQAEVNVELLPLQGEMAHLLVRTALPGADVLVDGKLLGRTPLPASLSLPPGPHEVSLRRPGYRAIPGNITLADGSTGEITIEAAENPDDAALVAGQIELDINQSDANITIDGVPRFRSDLSLPAGPHRLSVTRAGFLPFERELTVDKGVSKTMRISLQPKEELRNAQSRRRRNAWITVGAGVVVAGVGGYFAWQGHKDRQAADAAYNEVAPQLVSGASCSKEYLIPGSDAEKACQAKVDRVNSMQDHAKLKQWIGWGAVGVGGVVLVTGVILRIVANSTGDVTVASSHLQPFAWADPQGGGFGVLGRF